MPLPSASESPTETDEPLTVLSKRPPPPTVTDEPPSKRYKFGAIITILAGPEEHPFKIDEGLVCAKSPFIASACSENWKGSRDAAVRVPDIEAAVMENYIWWVYKDKLPPQTKETSFSGSVGEHAASAIYEQHIDLYLAAQYLRDDALHVLVIDSLLLVFPLPGWTDWNRLVEKVWERTVEDSGLRRLMVDTTLVCLKSHLLSEWLWNRQFEFVHAIAVRTLQGVGKPEHTFHPKQISKCYYHDHKEDEKCMSPAIKK